MNPLSLPKLNLNLWDLKNKQQLKLSENNFNTFAKKKINKNFKKTKCPCGIKKKPVLVKKFNQLSYYQCNCKTIYLNPMITKNNLQEIYKNNGIYEKHRRKILYEKKSKILRKSINRRKALQILKLLKNKNKSKILDYGCGDGEFLNYLNKSIKKENLFGFDLNTNLKKTSKKIKVFSKFSDLKSKKFDVITLWGVLEHVNNPNNLISLLSKIIKKKGFLVLEIPSSDSLIAKYTFLSNLVPIRWFEPYRHLFFFSLNCIKKIFKDKFKLKYIETNGFDLQTIFDNENTKDEKKVINSQKILNDNLLGDHYRIFLRRV